MKPAKGLKIKDIQTGEGHEVALGNVVHFHCTCQLSKGEIVFSTKNDAPFQIRVGQRDAYVALAQGLLGMRVGGRREIKVPPNLTYYERETFLQIPEGAVLFYEIQVIRIAPAWDNTLFIRESPIYSEETKSLERKFRSLEPSAEPDSEFQKVQMALFTRAEEERLRRK
jgi:peptidylprolyl isomerase